MKFLFNYMSVIYQSLGLELYIVYICNS